MKSVVLFFIFIGITLAQQSIPQYYQVDQEFSEKLHQIIQELDLDKDFDVGEDGIEQISFAVIDLNSALPKFGGVNYDNFIYPASVYKMYVAAEILNQVSQGKLSLYQDYYQIFILCPIPGYADLIYALDLRIVCAHPLRIQ